MEFMLSFQTSGVLKTLFFLNTIKVHKVIETRPFLSPSHVCLSVGLSPQEQMADGVRSPAALAPPFLLSASYSVDKEALTKLLIVLAVAAAVLAFVIEKAT